MSLFGWCLTGGHHKECPQRLQRFYIGTIGRGRNKKDGPIFLDEWHECDCYCHRPTPVKTKKKTKGENKTDS